jgi:hypothetical protein
MHATTEKLCELLVPVGSMQKTLYLEAENTADESQEGIK